MPATRKVRYRYRAVRGQGLLVDGHADDPDALEAEVLAWLDASVTDAWKRRQVRTLVGSALLGRAWWGGPQFGFVGEQHADAVPVTVVHLPDHVIDGIVEWVPDSLPSAPT